MKNQIIYIHGGETFDNADVFYEYLKKREYNPFENRKSWRDWVALALSEDYEMMAPSMPSKLFADYPAWKIWFEKLFPYLTETKLVVIGHSLGGLFLAKYLSENTFPKGIDQLHLVAAPFDNTGLVDETLGNFMIDPTKLSSVEPQADEIFLYHSTDDPIVPYAHSKEFEKYLPKAHLVTFADHGHFKQPAFIELLQNIYKLRA